MNELHLSINKELCQKITKKYLEFLCTEDVDPKLRLEFKGIIYHLYSICKTMERPLSEREKKYIEFATLGKTNKEIAILMKVKISTVNEYRRRILEKKGCHKLHQVLKEIALD